MAIISALKLIMFACVCHCAPCYLVLVDHVTTYGQCYPYEAYKFVKTKSYGFVYYCYSQVKKTALPKAVRKA